MGCLLGFASRSYELEYPFFVSTFTVPFFLLFSTVVLSIERLCVFSFCLAGYTFVAAERFSHWANRQKLVHLGYIKEHSGCFACVNIQAPLLDGFFFVNTRILVRPLLP